MWTALVARDRHCAFPSCTRPPVMCHAHHIRHWADGGETALDNLVLLCGHHHRTIHHTPWRVRLGHNRRPEFLPPAKVGRPPTDWIRYRPRLT
ncbi:MAG: HNH endonuclease signature motif containing protein [Nocardioides sp.]